MYADLYYVLLAPKPFQGTVGISGPLLLLARKDQDREAHTLVTLKKSTGISWYIQWGNVKIMETHQVKR